MRIKFFLIAFSLLVFVSLPFAHLHAATDSWQEKLKTFEATNGVFVQHKHEEVEFWRGPCWNPANKATMGILQSNWSYDSEPYFDLTVSGFPKDPVVGGIYASYDINRRSYVQEVRSNLEGEGTVLVKYFRTHAGKLQIMALASTPEKYVYLCEFNAKKGEVWVPQE